MTTPATIEWPTITPLPEATTPPAFPTDALPTWLAHFVRALSTASQVPEDMPGMLALSALSAAAQGRINVISNGGSWVEPVCLYTAVVMAPGERKSSVFEQVAAPLVDWEYEVQQMEAPLVAQSQREATQLQKAVEATASAVEKARAGEAKARHENLPADTVRAAEADLTVAQEEAENALIRQMEFVQRHRFRLVANDLTPEVAANMLSKQLSHHLAILSDEGGVFEVLTGSRYSDRLNLDVFLKSHSGNLIQVDRINREPERINRPILSLGLAVQPAVLADIGKSKQMHGRGLLARFLWCVPQTLRGSRLVNAPAVPEAIREQYDANLREIAGGAHGQDAVHRVFLTDEAEVMFTDYQEEIEDRLGEEGDLDPIIDWASKLAGAILRIGTLIATAREHGMPADVQADDMAAAIGFSDYLIAHANRAFGLMGILPSTPEKAKLIEAIRAHGWTSFNLRDLARGTSLARRLDNARLEALLDELQADGYVHKQTLQMRPLRVQWVVNPEIQEQAA